MIGESVHTLRCDGRDAQLRQPVKLRGISRETSCDSEESNLGRSFFHGESIRDDKPLIFSHQMNFMD